MTRAKITYELNFEWRLILNSQLLQQASVLDIDEQIELVEAIWDGIVSRGAAPSLIETQITELVRRLADHLANPNGCPDLPINTDCPTARKPLPTSPCQGRSWFSYHLTRRRTCEGPSRLSGFARNQLLLLTNKFFARNYIKYNQLVIKKSKTKPDRLVG